MEGRFRTSQKIEEQFADKLRFTKIEKWLPDLPLISTMSITYWWILAVVKSRTESVRIFGGKTSSMFPLAPYPIVPDQSSTKRGIVFRLHFMEQRAPGQNSPDRIPFLPPRGSLSSLRAFESIGNFSSSRFGGFLRNIPTLQWEICSIVVYPFPGHY